ncbi:MAG: 2-oxo-4-hydroxy-4-carboxy-5-ureidoimidazoline decarboxylase [Paracoccaceae bacterium]|nr:2-oxo-4-hydroxy-4-carboxy-5-ureidoimidazoline decarboxylase [Paracoccaceae bacterium]
MILGVVGLVDIRELNNCDEKRALQLLEPVIERAPAVVMQVLRHRPFADLADLILRISEELYALSDSQRMDLFQAHPELATDQPQSMTIASQKEQGQFGLTSSDNAHRTRLEKLNRAYREKFGFPFIVALSSHTSMDSVFAEFDIRLSADKTSEINRALEQICSVSAERVRRTFGGPDANNSAPADAQSEAVQ